MTIGRAFLSAVCIGIALTLAGLRLSDRAAEAALSGAAIYEDRCAICHESSGEGVPGTFPPLARNPHVTANDASAAVAATLNGMLVDITVRGHRYVGGMPGWRNWLSDADVAAVVTYIRTSWGNHASAVSPAQVARIRGSSSIVTP
jgi:mono/diheme cytochrome c family protein